MEIRDAAFVLGLVLGTLAIVSACWVWLRRQTFGVGGGVLSMVGLVLVGLSVWSTAKVQVSPTGGLSAEFERLERQVDELAERNAEVAEEVVKVAEAVDTTRSRFVDLTEALERRPGFRPGELESLRAPVPEPLTTDVEALREIAREPVRRQP